MNNQQSTQKGTLTFSLPEQKVEFMAAVRAMDLLSTLQDVDNELRNYIKHEDSRQVDPIEFMEEVRSYIWDETSRHD